MKKFRSLIGIAILVFNFGCDSTENSHPHFTGEGHVHDDVVKKTLSEGTVDPLFGKLVIPKQDHNHTEYSIVTFVNPKRLKFKSTDGHTKDKTHRHVIWQKVEFPQYDSLGKITKTAYVYELLKFK
jgi:hypothetical protein